MADVVNLRLARKRAIRNKAAAGAAANRVAHGTSSADRDQSKIEREKSRRMLDHHRIEPGDGR
jgi:hypothetical protein